MSNLIYLSLGSNLGNREENIASAIAILGNYRKNTIVKNSSFYETEPLYDKEQPYFLNTVTELKTGFKPFELLDIISKTENMLGRPELRKKCESRTLDIDILTFGDTYLETDELFIPHPGIPLRKFVLIPFAEIAPNFILPKWKISVNKMLEQCSDNSEVVKYSTNLN